MKQKVKHSLLCLFISLLMCSCGLRENPESFLDFGDDDPVPVAESYDIQMPVPLGTLKAYTFNERWFYCIDPKFDMEEKHVYYSLYRSSLSGGEFEPELCVKELKGVPTVLLTDREDNCVLFGKGDNGQFVLQKYDKDGVLQWCQEFTAQQMREQGDGIQDGVIGGDGRTYLYTYGAGGSVFVFGQDGSLQGVHVPELEELQGIAEGRESRVYGYCLTGEEPVFTAVEGKERYVCPIVPLQAYGGAEDGIYLCVGEGLRRYDPETGETGKVFDWDDEYVQIDGARVQQIFRGAETVQVLSLERHMSSRITYIGEILTFAAVSYGERGEYPPKQEVTLGRAYNTRYDSEASWMEDLVRRYNRQSRDYKVVVVYPEEELRDFEQSDELLKGMELQLLRGEGPDLLQVAGLDIRSMASKGVFEDLDAYYAASDRVSQGDILESVGEACRVQGKNVLVIPYFYLDSMLVRGDIDMADWTPWRFLEFTGGDGAAIYPRATQMEAFWYCMGARLEGRFVDYERRECYFETETFRKVLEECGKWKAAEMPVIYIYGDEDSYEITEEALAEALAAQEECLINPTSLSDSSNIRGFSHLGDWLGYPGWNGAENIIDPSEIFAINSASERKEGAWDFLEFLLSDASQDTLYRGFPVRRDSFEEYLARTYIDHIYRYEEFEYWVEPVEDIVPTQEDIARLRSMVDSAVCRDALNWKSTHCDPVRIIIEDEVGMYFAGDATLEETVNKIQSRVTLYLNESS